jgi:hypothetical protein
VRILKKKGYDALSVGLTEHNTDETRQMLYGWADRIFIASEEMLDLIPDQYKSKVRSLFVVGPDFWNRPQDSDLVRVYLNLFDRYDNTNFDWLQ